MAHPSGQETELAETEPAAEAPAPALLGILPDIAIAGAVANEEELLRVQQIALITRWLRHFTSATHGDEAGPGEPRKVQAGGANGRA